MMQKASLGIKDVTIDAYYPKRNKKITCPVSDTIYTLDIETTNLFKIDGEYKRFDYSIEDYRPIEKVACPYIYMFGVEDTVYYGREFRELHDVFKSIADPNLTKICYIHNLAFEFAWLLNIIAEHNLTISDMCARDVKKPIQFKIEEYNIIFRCSYMLTNLSLERASKEYTTLSKKVGDLDYSLERSPLTRLTKKELGYCEYDIRCLYHIVKHFREEYNHLFLIPLTSTGIVRQALRERVGFHYIKRQQALVPPPDIYLKLWATFSGGFTHANILRSNRVLNNVESEDEASAYPSILCTEEFPYTPFMRVPVKHFFKPRARDGACYMLLVEFHNLKSRYYNHYLQKAKIFPKPDENNCIEDNGRLVSLDYGNMYITDIDYDIIRKNYAGDIKIKECYKSYKRYLDKEVIKFILSLYSNKTTLKNVKGMEAIYRRDKGRLNSCFGMSVTNALKQSSNYENGFWSHKELTNDFIESKLVDMKKSFSTLFFYAVGVWVCAYGRKRLFDIILSSKDMDRDVVYCDTDSIKFLNREKHQDIFLTYNNDMIEKYRAVCEVYDDINISDFMPADPQGILHPLGFFEFDGFYTEMVTLGAKKYCYREDGELHITVSGVSKKGVKALNNDIHNFKKGFIWDYKNSGKLALVYHELDLTEKGVIDNLQKPFTFTDIDGNNYTCDYPYSVVLMPTTYKLGISDIYEAVLEEYIYRGRAYNGSRDKS